MEVTFQLHHLWEESLLLPNREKGGWWMRQWREKYPPLSEIESWSPIPQAVTKNGLPWIEITKFLSYLHSVLERCFIEEKTEELRPILWWNWISMDCWFRTTSLLRSNCSITEGLIATTTILRAPQCHRVISLWRKLSVWRYLNLSKSKNTIVTER
jgi:hypothetical protein